MSVLARMVARITGAGRGVGATEGPAGIIYLKRGGPAEEVAGGLVDETDVSAPTTEEVRRLDENPTSPRRLDTPEDLARADSVFASSRSGFVTGQYVACRGLILEGP